MLRTLTRGLLERLRRPRWAWSAALVLGFASAAIVFSVLVSWRLTMETAALSFVLTGVIGLVLPALVTVAGFVTALVVGSLPSGRIVAVAIALFGLGWLLFFVGAYVLVPVLVVFHEWPR
jgi:hypothetical protein